MHFRNIVIRSFVSLFALSLVLNAAAWGGSSRDDKSDAWISVSTMIRFIGMGDPASTERAGNEAVGSLEKAVAKEEDSSKKDKLIDAKTQVREALSKAADGKWDYADAAAKKALQMIEDAK